MTPQRLECDVLLACAATRSRSRRSDIDEKEIRLPQQRVRTDAATSHCQEVQDPPSRNEPVWIQTTCHLEHCPQGITMYGTCRRDWRVMVGGGSTRSRSPVLTPRGTGDRQPSDPSRRTRRLVAFDARNHPRTSKGIPGKLCRFLGRRPPLHSCNRNQRSKRRQARQKRPDSHDPRQTDHPQPDARGRGHQRGNMATKPRPTSKRQQRGPTNVCSCRPQLGSRVGAHCLFVFAVGVDS